MHAYLIMAHCNQWQLEQLLKCLDYEDNDIYIHLDSKFKDVNVDGVKKTCKKSRIYITRRTDVYWGGWSQIYAELMLIESAVNNRKYEYLHLLSGMDLPIKSQKEIHDFFN